MLLKMLMVALVFSTLTNALVTVPSDTKVSIYDFCSYKVPCAPGHLCHEGFCIQQQNYEYESLPRSLFYRSLFRR